MSSCEDLDKEIPKPDLVKKAIFNVILDKEGKYDECLVDRLFGSVAIYAGHRRIQLNEWLSDLYDRCVPQSLEYGQLINLTRLFKYHGCIIERTSMMPPLQVTTTRIFLLSLPHIIQRNKTPEISAAMSLLCSLVPSKFHYDCLKDYQFTYPLRLRRQVDASTRRSARVPDQTSNSSSSNNNSDENTINGLPQQDCDAGSYLITDIVALVRYCLETSKVYHIQNFAKKSLIHLILMTSRESRPPIIAESLRQTMNELLMVTKSPVSYQLVAELFYEAPPSSFMTELYQYIKSLIRQAFDLAREQQQQERDLSRQQELVSLAKCLALARVSDNDTLDKLKSTNDLEAIITYATNVNVFAHSPLLCFVIYPILARCNSEDAQLLTGKLFMTREEKYFVERNLKDKHVLQCLSYLKHALGRKLKYVSTAIPHKKLVYTLNVVLEYLKCNYESSRAYKDLLECCEILSEGQARFSTLAESIWSFQLIDEIHELLERRDLDSGANKTIFLELIQLLSKSHLRSTIYRNSTKIGKIRDNWVRTIRLVGGTTDEDVLYEFAHFFHLTTCDQILEYEHSKQYVELIWDHMLPYAKQGNHPELLGLVASLLIRIDLSVPKMALIGTNIERHRDIPLQIGDILMNFSTVYAVVEKIIESLTSVNTKEMTDKQDSDSRHRAKIKMGYLEWLDSGTLGRHAKDSLEHLTTGVCLAIKGESSEFTKHGALNEINALVSTLLINNDSPIELLKRLVRTGILEILHEVMTCSLYTNALHLMASDGCSKIKRHVVDKLGRREEAHKEIMNLISSDDPSRQERAKKVADFYTSKSEFKKIKLEQKREPDPDQLGLAAYLEDILDQDRISWGTSECY